MYLFFAESLCGLIQSQLKSEFEFKRVQFISIRCRRKRDPSSLNVPRKRTNIQEELK